MQQYYCSSVLNSKQADIELQTILKQFVMAIPWGKGGDFKFYTGSSQNSAWTRDLLHKKNIMEEAKLMGFLPKNSAHGQGKPEQKAETPTAVSLVETARSTASRQPPQHSARSQIAASVNTGRLSVASRASRGPQSDKMAFLAEAKKMFEERKLLGGPMTKVEQQRWEAFIGKLEGAQDMAPKSARIPKRIGEMSIAQLARQKASMKKRNGHKYKNFQNVNAIALARDSQAIRDRKVAVKKKTRKHEKTKLRGACQPSKPVPASDSLNILNFEENPNLPRAKRADWTTKNVATIFKPLDVEKPYLTDNFMSTYDKNFGERERPKKKLVGGYFVKVKT